MIRTIRFTVFYQFTAIRSKTSCYSTALEPATARQRGHVTFIPYRQIRAGKWLRKNLGFQVFLKKPLKVQNLGF